MSWSRISCTRSSFDSRCSDTVGDINSWKSEEGGEDGIALDRSVFTLLHLVCSQLSYIVKAPLVLLLLRLEEEQDAEEEEGPPAALHLARRTTVVDFGKVLMESIVRVN